MEIEQLRHCCLSKKSTQETMPFDNHTLVFKVMGKMFALTSLAGWDGDEPVNNLKCNPQRAIELRQQYDGDVVGAWHMNKKHWNGIHINNSVRDTMIFQWIDDSYDLVVSSLTKKLQAQLKST